jgi:hypothetical protein
MIEPTPELAAKLDRDRREAAEAMTPGQRLLAGAAMFDINLKFVRAGVRLQNPDADEATIERLVLERLHRRRWSERT